MNDQLHINIQSEYKMAVEYMIRQGRREDMPGLLKLVWDEGWNDVLEHLHIQFDLFTEGVFVAESSEGEIISTCASVPLDTSNGFIAFYITKISCRGLGIGRQVFDLSFKALGNRNVGLNAVWDKSDMYAAGGFKISSLTLQTYEFPLKKVLETTVPESQCKIVDIKEVDVEHILGYDRKIHPMPREKIIKWALGFAFAGRVAFDGDEIKGWGTVNKSNRGYRLMPLYSDTPEVAAALAVELLKQVAVDPEVEIEVCFPKDNKTAEELYSKLGVLSGECKHTKNRRMFTERDIPVPSHFVFSILSFDNVLT